MEYLAPDVEYPVPDAEYLVPGVEYLVPNAKYLEPAAKVPVPAADSLDPGAKVPEPDVVYLEPAAKVLVPGEDSLDPGVGYPMPDAKIPTPGGDSFGVFRLKRAPFAFGRVTFGAMLLPDRLCGRSSPARIERSTAVLEPGAASRDDLAAWDEADSPAGQKRIARSRTAEPQT